MKQVNYQQFVDMYCERQQSTPEELLVIFKNQLATYHCDGWFMAEAQLMDSSWYGSRVILPFGPNNTFKEVPKTPFTPRGLASDTSTAICFISKEDLPEA